jgi:hypothetical protein
MARLSTTAMMAMIIGAVAVSGERLGSFARGIVRMVLLWFGFWALQRVMRAGTSAAGAAAPLRAHAFVIF